MNSDSKNLDSIVSKALLFVAIAWLINATLILFFDSTEKSGQFGDTFGAINALFSGLAFVGLIYAILLQRQDIKIQSQELKATVEEFKVQNQTLKKQQFENTFFNMISLYSEVIKNLNIRRSSGAKDIDGRQVLTVMFDNFKRDWRASNGSESIEERYQILHKKQYPGVLGLCFRNLGEIIKFVDTSEINNKNFYVNILKAQLGLHELLLLFYYGFCHEQGISLKPFIEKYNLFDQLPINEVLEEEHLQRYDAKAFDEGINPQPQTNHSA